MSKTIPIIELQDGMILKKPVVNKFGQVLLREGTELKQSHIRVLQLWGINFLTIETNEQESSLEIDESILEKSLELIKQRMHWEPRNKHEFDLLELAKKAIANQIIKGEL